MLILSITVLFLIYAIHNYFTYEFTINEAKKTTLLRSEAQANNIVQDLDKYINSRTNVLQSLTKTKQIQNTAIESNKYFTGSNLTTSSLTNVHVMMEESPFLADSTKKEIIKELRVLVSPYNEYENTIMEI
ncbi:MAG: hypothetical protein HZB73_00685 [Nitrosarchaeum sp.]|nr:hypothetical protein [Nitrosarchaeum sp.]